MNRPGEKPRAIWPIAAGVAATLLAAVLIRGWFKSPSPRPALSPKPVAAEAVRDPSSLEESAASVEARRARDAMREQILAALKARDAGVAAARAAPKPIAAQRPAEDPPPHGHYEAKYIQDTFHEEMFPMVKKCYESALVRKPELAGRLVLTFSIVGDPSVGGVVEDADFAEESDLKDTEMETCVRESLMTLTFDKPPSGGGLVTVKYPILFSPGDEPPDDAAAD